jgi:hypothetical protein
LPDCIVGNKDNAFHITFGDRKDPLADTARRERVRRDPTGLGVDGPACRERLRQRGGGLRLDPDHPDLSLVPCGNAADQSAAADGNQQRVEIGDLLLELQADGTLTKQGLPLIEGVNRERTGLGGEDLAGAERVGIAVAADDELGAAIANPLNLRRRRDARHEDPGPDAEFHRRVRDRSSVIAARGGDNAGCRDVAHEQVRESAACLERARVLEQLELAAQAQRAQSEIGSIDLDDRRSAYVRPDEPLGRGDLVTADGVGTIHVRPAPRLPIANLQDNFGARGNALRQAGVLTVSEVPACPGSTSVSSES